MSLIFLNLTLNDDSTILNEFSKGNVEIAATAFVRKHQKFVYLTAFRYLNNYDDAEDIAQEVFIKALQNLKKFENKSNIKTWLYRITANQCLSLLRKKKFKSYFSSENIEELDLPDYSSPDKIYEQTEFNHKFLKALNQLPLKQRETFSLRYFEELSYNQISEMIGTSVGGLKANYFQAVKKLATLLNNKD